MQFRLTDTFTASLAKLPSERQKAAMMMCTFLDQRGRQALFGMKPDYREARESQ